MRVVVIAVSLLMAASATTASIIPSAAPDGVASNLRPQTGDADWQLAQGGEREGQDPDAAVEVLPGGGEPGERVGNDPDVPIGAQTPVSAEPGKRVGNDPDVPGGDEPVK